MKGNGVLRSSPNTWASCEHAKLTFAPDKHLLFSTHMPATIAPREANRRSPLRDSRPLQDCRLLIWVALCCLVGVFEILGFFLCVKIEKFYESNMISSIESFLGLYEERYV
jgi:hypothetical protein